MDLYKLDTKSKLRILKVYVNDDNLHQDSGLVDGKLTLRNKVCTPKNVGRSNETTGHQQALFQADAVIKRKLREGYSKTQQEALMNVHISPMLAHNFHDHRLKIDWATSYGNYKVDGVRGNWVKQEMISRKNKPFETIDHIVQALKPIDLMLDGEIYVSTDYTFQETVRLIKKYRPGETELLKYHAYDAILDLPYIDRFHKLEETVGDNEVVELIRPFKITSFEELENFNIESLKLGYEGSMLRWGHDGHTMNKRSDRLLKFKQFMDIDAKIIDITPNDADPTMGTPWFEYTHDEGEFDGETVIFKTGVKGSHEYRRDMLTNKQDFIGQMGSVRFFEWTDEGKARFGIFHGIHIDR